MRPEKGTGASAGLQVSSASAKSKGKSSSRLGATQLGGSRRPHHLAAAKSGSASSSLGKANAEERRGSRRNIVPVDTSKPSSSPSALSSSMSLSSSRSEGPELLLAMSHRITEGEHEDASVMLASYEARKDSRERDPQKRKTEGAGSLHLSVEEEMHAMCIQSGPGTNSRKLIGAQRSKPRTGSKEAAGSESKAAGLFTATPTRRNNSESTARCNLKAFCMSIVQDQRFEWTMGFIVTVNCLCLGVEGEIEEDDAGWQNTLLILDRIFLGIFTAELLLVGYGCGLEAFRCPAGALDVFIVTSGWVVDVILPVVVQATSSATSEGGPDLKVLQIVKMFRALRAVRVLRVLTMFEDLWLTVQSFLFSLKPLIWTVLFVLMIIYLFAIFSVGLIGHNDFGPQRNPEAQEQLAEVQLRFKSTVTAIVTLFQIMTLDEWFDILDPVFKAAAWTYLFFILYIAICALALMNLVTAVVVDSAIRKSTAETELDLEQANFEQEVNNSIQEMSLFFKGADMDSSKLLDVSEFVQSAKHWRKIQHILETLGFCSPNSDEEHVEASLRSIFDILASNYTPPLSMQEFMTSVLKLERVNSDKSLVAMIRSATSHEQRVLFTEKALFDAPRLQDQIEILNLDMQAGLQVRLDELTNSVRSTCMGAFKQLYDLQSIVDNLEQECQYGCTPHALPSPVVEDMGRQCLDEPQSDDARCEEQLAIASTPTVSPDTVVRKEDRPSREQIQRALLRFGVSSSLEDLQCSFASRNRPIEMKSFAIQTERFEDHSARVDASTQFSDFELSGSSVFELIQLQAPTNTDVGHTDASPELSSCPTRTYTIPPSQEVPSRYVRTMQPMVRRNYPGVRRATESSVGSERSRCPSSVCARDGTPRSRLEPCSADATSSCKELDFTTAFGVDRACDEARALVHSRLPAGSFARREMLHGQTWQLVREGKASDEIRRRLLQVIGCSENASLPECWSPRGLLGQAVVSDTADCDPAEIGARRPLEIHSDVGHSIPPIFK